MKKASAEATRTSHTGLGVPAMIATAAIRENNIVADKGVEFCLNFFRSSNGEARITIGLSAGSMVSSSRWVQVDTISERITIIKIRLDFFILFNISPLSLLTNYRVFESFEECELIEPYEYEKGFRLRDGGWQE